MPIPYLLNAAVPALRRGTARVQRPAPPLVAHVLVALSQDRQATLEATRQRIGRYGKLPFYAKMFAVAGFPVAADGTLPDALGESLVRNGHSSKRRGLANHHQLEIRSIIKPVAFPVL